VRLACYDAHVARPAPPAASPSPVAPPPAAAPVPPPENFGKTRKPEVPDEPPSLTAHLVGTLQSWERGTVFRLDNGQVWKCTGEDSAYYPDIPPNPEVTIRRGFFGAYWMEVHGVNRRIKVKRVS
jgi:hypothetical protein